MNTEYRTKISDRQWIAYDIPGNIGWITWLVCTVRGLREKRDLHSIAAMVPAVLMVTGVVELISERIHGLDRILSGKRLFRGFGVLTAGGLLGIPIALVGVSFSEIESPSLLVRRGSLSLLRGHAVIDKARRPVIYRYDMFLL